MTRHARYLKLKSLYLESRSLSAAERDRFLRAQCAEQPGLQLEVEELLALDSQLLPVSEHPEEPPQETAATPPLQAGHRVGPYEIEARLGSGGMGVVYRARDVRLDRPVALKLLGPSEESTPPGEGAFERFLGEARAASALDHPNLCTVHDFGVWEEHTYLAMAYYGGQTLEDRLESGPLPVDEAVDIAAQVADGLAAAHTEGIVHRDLKPSNVMLPERGPVKILDFGLATHLGRKRLTRTGLAVGTPGFMAPEQLKSEKATPATDVWALGVLLYEMLAGEPPFSEESLPATLYSTVYEEPRDLKAARPETPEWLVNLISQCLRKAPEKRYADAGEVCRALAARRRLPDGADGMRGPVRRRLAAAAYAALAAIAMAILLLVPGWRRDSQLRWLQREALPEMRHLAETDLAAAYRLALDARRKVRDDPQVEQIWLDLTLPVSLHSDPPGAEIAVRGYRESDRDWLQLGRTPLEDVRLPLTSMQLHVSLEGHVPIEVAPGVLPAPETLHLHTPDQTPDGMVFVPAGRVHYLLLAAELPDFWIDRLEVTNREFRRFIEDGGYRRPEFWRHAASEDGRTLPWEELTARLVDGTGMPGPSTWALGTYAEGEDDHPVEGVSWFEAAAYAEYVGKSLPTVFHWSRAAGLGTAQLPNFSDILAASNFGGRGTVPVGTLNGLGPYGTHDMAGNVAEWCANSAGEHRHILGGSWMDNSYQFRDFYAQHALERRPGFGIRLVEQREPMAAEILDEVFFPDRVVPEPVDDTTFALYARLYDYDPEPLDATLDAVDDSHQAWRRERVSFAAAYPGERVIAQILLPRDGLPPFQTVVHFPGGDALMLDSIQHAGLLPVEPYLRSGRAVVYPVYQGTFERRIPGASGPIARRNLLIQQVKDFRRTIDYLETRDDVDLDRLAFHGLSYGGVRAPFVLALEHRLKTAMIVSAGVIPTLQTPAEIQMQNYLPRVTLPVLLISGREDFNFPYETSQLPFFDLLGSPPEHKRHVALDWGHIPQQRTDVSRELLSWVDRWLGPVSGEARE